MKSYEDPAEIAKVFGIEIEWLYEVDKACDLFFKRRGMKPLPTVREQIGMEMRLGKRLKHARSRQG